MRFLHTADWQIGMKAGNLGKVAEEVRAARLDTVRRIQVLAREQEVEFVVVAGDTFEDHGVSRKLVAQVGDVLGGFDCDVYVIPGNHDPWVPGGVWDQARQWRRAVHVLGEPTPVEVAGGCLYPCPLTERWSEKDPTEWIKVEKPEGIHVGIAHGSLRMAMGASPKNHPIMPKAASRAGLDYLALGDWHSVMEVSEGGPAVRMAYSGTPEPTSFGEVDSGYVLIVDIEARGSAPKISRHQVGALKWLNRECALDGAGDLGRLIEELKRLPDPRRTLISIALGGVLFAEEAERLEDLSDVLSTHFLYGRVDDKALIPAPQDDAWTTHLPEGVIRSVAERLKEEADSGRDPIARQALFELYRLAN